MTADTGEHQRACDASAAADGDGVEDSTGPRSTSAHIDDRSLYRRVGVWCGEHPLIVVAVLSGLLALACAVWIWQNRTLGSYDPDEAGYLATALLYERVLGPNAGLIREFLSVTTGPIIPLLSLPFSLVGPRTPQSAMMIQPVLLVLTSVSVAGITRKMAGPGAAILSGVVAAAMPTMVLATTSYWYGLGTAASMAAAVWALVSSDRLTNRWRWAFGAAIGLMLLARTMALGFVPGLGLAALLVAWGDRRRLIGLAQAAVVAVVIAAPWWYAQRDAIFEYLFGYGFGERAGLWGSGGPLERLWFRLGRFAEGLGLFTPYLLIPLTAVAVVVAVKRLPWTRPLLPVTRYWVACVVIVLAGLASLVSTTNQGVWFELPIIVLLIPVLAAGFDRLRPRLRLVVAVPVAVYMLAVPTSILGTGIGHADGALEEHDARFSTSERSDAAQEWLQLNEDVAEHVRHLQDRDEPAAIYLTGNTFLLNTNSVNLVAEMQGWRAALRVPDTWAGPEEWEQDLTPTLDGEFMDGRERVIIAALHERPLFTPDLEVSGFYERALDIGWQRVAEYPMPLHGQVIVLRHEDWLDGTTT